MFEDSPVKAALHAWRKMQILAEMLDKQSEEFEALHAILTEEEITEFRKERANAK